MAEYTGSYASRPAYSLRASISTYQQDAVANKSRFSVRVYIRHDTSASNGTYAYTARAWGLSVGLWTATGTAPFLMGPSGDYVGKEITIYSGITAWIEHDPDGTLTLAVAAYHNMAPDVMGNASAGGSYVVEPIDRNLLRAGIEDAWVTCETYVGINGAWIPAQPRVGVDDAWALLDNAA